MGESCAPVSTESSSLCDSAATSTFASVPSVTCGYVFIRGWSEMLAVSLITIMQKSVLAGYSILLPAQP